ncbi:hypothetical protein BJ742DRAFT_872309 [Cladochytrium replicatum]|nr:hypothetical protein BJ742DRAFT_872309 [Cladochytrium replicatum]
MLDLLVREALVSEPGSVEEGGCAELFLNTNLLGHLIRISESDIPDGFRGEVIHFLSSFIGLLDGKIQNAIHRPTLYLLRKPLHDRTSMRVHVATFFYLQEMVRTAIESDEVSRLLCEFLMWSEEDDEGLTEWVEGIDENGEREHTGEADPPLDEENSEFRIHVRDILLSKLNSLSEEVMTSTLRLIHSLLSHQSHNALRLIIEELPRALEDGSSGSKLDIQQHLAIHSYQINHALTSVLSQLASEPEPLLYMYLFSAESFLDPPNSLIKEAESRSSRDGTAPNNSEELESASASQYATAADATSASDPHKGKPDISTKLPIETQPENTATENQDGSGDSSYVSAKATEVSDPSSTTVPSDSDVVDDLAAATSATALAVRRFFSRVLNGSFQQQLPGGSDFAGVVVPNIQSAAVVLDLEGEFLKNVVILEEAVK